MGKKQDVGELLSELRDKLIDDLKDLKVEYDEKDSHGVLQQLFDMQRDIANAGLRITEQFDKD